MSSGAIGSPQILLLSGIGPKAELKKLNISVVFDNKFVGKGMSDNPLNTIFVPTNRPVQQSLIQTVGITKMGVYIEASSGYGETEDSIHCHHGIVSAEVSRITSTSFKYTVEILTISSCLVGNILFTLHTETENF